MRALTIHHIVIGLALIKKAGERDAKQTRQRRGGTANAQRPDAADNAGLSPNAWGFAQQAPATRVCRCFWAARPSHLGDKGHPPHDTVML